MGENLGFEFVGLAYPLKDVGFGFRFIKSIVA
jgi:hypothetical protein